MNAAELASPVPLESGEQLHASVEAHAWRYLALDVAYKHHRDLARPHQTHASAMPAAAALLTELIRMLERLRVIVLLAKQAQKGWDRISASLGVPTESVTVLRCPSCSPQAWNNVDRSDPTGRNGREVTMATLLATARLIGGIG